MRNLGPQALALILAASLGCQSLAPRPSAAQSPPERGTLTLPATTPGPVPLTTLPQGSSTVGARIITTLTEEVELAPDRAMLAFTVETRAKTAAAAAAENARIQTALLDTLRKLGVASAQLRTQGFSLSPEYEYPRDGARPQLVGYQAQNSVLVEVRSVSAVGSIIDAGLAKGAMNAGSLRFFASNTEVALREALKRAVARALVDANAIAEAAGGRIEGVLEITVLPTPGMRPGPETAGGVAMRSMQAADVNTPVESGSLRLSVSIEARFAFAWK